MPMRGFSIPVRVMFTSKVTLGSIPINGTVALGAIKDALVSGEYEIDLRNTSDLTEMPTLFITPKKDKTHEPV